MKKKGFMLIELLAIIVVLSVISLIATPLILNVIEKAKIGALESSVNGLVESANMYYANNTIKVGTLTETIFNFEDGSQVSDNKLSYKGKVYNGKLILHASGEVAVCIDDKEHYAYKNKDTDEIVSGIGTCKYDGTTGDFSSNSLITDLRGKTVLATNITKNEDETKVLIKIPEEGHYDTTSKISVPVETIKNEVTSLNSNVYYLGTGTSFDISDIPGYEELTVDNFIVGVSASNSIQASGYDSDKSYANCRYNNFSFQKAYNATTGILTITGNSYNITACSSSGNSNFCSDGSASGSINPFVYLVIGTIKTH